MADFLGRDQSRLSTAQWADLDETVVSIARRSLIGRRILKLFGALGPGVQVAPNDRFLGRNNGSMDMLGESEDEEITPSSRVYLPLPILHKDFVVHCRDLAEENQTGMHMDSGGAASAASYCARLEDELIFNGNADLGYDGLRTVNGRMTVPLSDWSVMGNA